MVIASLYNYSQYILALCQFVLKPPQIKNRVQELDSFLQRTTLGIKIMSYSDQSYLEGWSRKIFIEVKYSDRILDTYFYLNPDGSLNLEECFCRIINKKNNNRR